MKQTAVEWLMEQLTKNYPLTKESAESIIDQAKAMEKRQELKMPDYDLDELARTEYSVGEVWNDEEALIRGLAFKKGFQKALELLTFKSE